MVAFNAGSVVSDFTLDEGQGVAAMRTIRREATAMKGGVENDFKSAAANGTKSFKGLVKDISADFGKKSNLGLGLKLAAGGGAIGALSLAGSQLASVTRDMAEAMHEGGASSGEFASRIASGLPVMGEFFQVGQNIREMVTGESAAMRAHNFVLDAAKNAYDGAAEAIANMKKEYDAVRQSLKELNAENAKKGRDAFLPGGIKGDVQRLRFDQGDQLKTINDPVDAEKKKVDQLEKSWHSLVNISLDKSGNSRTIADNVANAKFQQLQAARTVLQKMQKDAAGATGISTATEAKQETALYFDAWKKGWTTFKGNAVDAFNGVNKKLMDAGAQLHQSLLTPAEQFKESMASLNSLRLTGNVSGQDYQRQLNATRNALLDMVSPNNSQLQAEEIGGHGTVTAQDVGEIALEQLKQQEATVEGINKLIDQVAKIPAATNYTRVTVGG